MNDELRFARNLELLRKDRGLTQQELSDLLGVKRSAIGSYEEGRAHAPFYVLIRMSRLFGCSIDVLIRGKLKPKL